jgi:hypothetical protein
MRWLSTFALLAALAGPAEPRTASEWIERMNAALWPVDAVAADATLTTEHPRGGGLDTKLKLVREEREGRVRTQIRVVAPPRAEGIVYEVHSVPGEKLQRIVYLPAFERTHEVSGVRRTDAFLGSYFTYEDLDIAAPLESRWDEVERIEEGGRSLVRVTSEPHSFYSRVETLIDPQTFLPVRVSYFDGEGRLHKRAVYRDVKQVQGHPIPTRIEMVDVQNDARSELRLERVTFDARLDEKLFSESPIAQHRAKNPTTPAPASTGTAP